MLRAFNLWHASCVLLLSLVASPTQAAPGRTPGLFAVSSEGAATYTIPIWTPPGSRGIQPSVSLRYDSQADNGIAGVGWSLSAVSSIDRCARTIAQDGVKESVSFGPTSRFCLDGNRLRLTSTTPYGADGSTYETEIANYARISAVGGGPDYFVVKGKNGLTYEYGNSATSRVTFTSGALPYRWMLNSVRDVYGNGFDITYEMALGVAVPSTITWAEYSVNFDYSDERTNVDSDIRVVAGFPVVNRKRLESITIRSAAATVRKYVLSYELSLSTSRSRLIAVTECADEAATNCLSPTTVRYQSGGTVNSGNVHAQASIIRGKFDFNGDGRDDLVYQESGYLWVALSNAGGFDAGHLTHVAATFPRDIHEFVVPGRDSIIVNENGTLHHSRWNSATASFTKTALAGVTQPAGTMPLVLDVNGDGLADFVDGTVNVSIRRNTTATGAVNPSFAASAFAIRLDQQGSGYGPGGQNWSAQNLRTQQTDVGLRHYDVDGDRRHDLYVIAAVGTPGPGNPPSIYGFTIRSLGTTFAVPPTSEWRPVDRNLAVHFNDDRCTDRLDNAVTVYISACNGNTSSTVTLPAAPSYVLDYDGDGRTDFLVSNGSNFGVYRSVGNGVSALEPTAIPVGDGWVMDKDGDGLDDWVRPNGVFHTHTAPGPTPEYATHLPDLLSSVTDGHGVSYALQYASTARTGYSPGTFPAGGPDSNQTQVPPPDAVIVVRLVTGKDGIGGEYTQTYTYTGARYDTSRDKGVGFQQIEVVDSRTADLRIKTYYEQDFPLTGRVSKREVLRDSGSKPLARTETIHKVHLLQPTLQYNERYSPWIEKVTEKTYEAEGLERLIATTEVAIAETDIDFSTGNVKFMSTTVTSADSASPGTWTSTVRTDYFAATPDCLALPLKITTTQGAPGQPAITRVVDFTQDSSQCRHQTQTVRGVPDARYDVTFTYAYDTYGNVSSVREDAKQPNDQGVYEATLTRESRWEYTGANCGLVGILPCRFINARNQSTSFRYYSETGLLRQLTDPNQLSVVWQYDDFGRPDDLAWPDGTSTSYEYIRCSSNCPGGGEHVMTVVETEKKGTTTLTDRMIYFDRFSRPIAARDRLLGSNYQWQNFKYNALGQLWRQSVPCTIANATSSCAAVWSELLYDVAGRIKTINSAGEGGTIRTTSFAYSGLETTITDPLNHQTRKLFDVLGRLYKSFDSDTYWQTFSYDSAGSLLSVAESDGRVLFEADYDYGIAAFQVSARSYAQTASTSYLYDGLGRPRQWTDAKGQKFQMSFDALSRPVSRRDGVISLTQQEALTSWIWGTGISGAKDIGQLSETSIASASGTYREIYGYDGFGRPSKHTIKIPSEPADYVYDFEYSEATGALETVRYPETTGTRFALRFGYEPGSGILNSVRDVNTDAAYWSLTGFDPFGQVREQFGNGVIRKLTYDAVTGWLEKLEAGPTGNETLLQNASVLYDEVGNVQQRANDLGSLPASLVEDFTNKSDPLYRFKTGTLRANGTVTATLSIPEYDNLGNIKQKSDTSGLDAPIDYTVAWTSYNYPASIESPTVREKASFAYGPDRQRWRMVYENLATNRRETTQYIGGLLEKVVVNEGTTSSTEYRYYIPGPGEAIAIHRRTSTGASTRYLLTDHLGSLDRVIDSSGAQLASGSYSPYGVRRDPSDWVGTPSSTSDDYTRQGYTFQTVLGRLGMNHMNGRVQDALTGTFLSPDPFVTDPGNTQNWNRYAYVYNNPLTYTDPSGFQARPDDDSDGGGILGSYWCAMGGICTGENAYLSMPYIGLGSIIGTGISWDIAEGVRELDRLTASDRNSPSLVRIGATVGVGFIPVVGSVQSIVELVTGHDYITGEKTSRGWAAVGVFAGLVGLKGVLKAATKADDIADGVARLANRTCCFVAGTLVMTDEGLRPIEEIEVGDLVLSRDEDTRETAYKPVTNVIRRHDREIWDVTFTIAQDGESTTAKFETTDDHPWRTSDSRWLNTAQLAPGVEIQRAEGIPATVVSVVRTERVAPTFNLQVAEFQNYFVGEARVWVHNCDVGSAIGFASGTAETAFSAMRGGGGHAIRHLEGLLIPKTGSLGSRVEAFKRIAIPILEGPVHTADWRIGATLGRAFLGIVDGRNVAVVVAKEGPYKGQVIGAFIPDPNQLNLIRSR